MSLDPIIQRLRKLEPILVPLACIVLFTGLFLEVREPLLPRIDSIGLWLVAAVRTPWLVSVMQAVSMAPFVALPAAAILLFARGRRIDSIGLVSDVCVALLSCEVLKVAIARPRPSDALVTALSSSFPSGHATVTAALVSFAALLWVRRHPGSAPRALAGCLAAIVLMDASRLVLGVHYVSDVLAGDALGTFVTWCVRQAFARMGSARRLASGGSSDRTYGANQAWGR